eukprot:snap_masked-scaffold_1-processed-gene-28.26-mRNA-1 protein AED:1.00 eAED:1.00 QI:0/-1/0/0/-1/1/1/0/170
MVHEPSRHGLIKDAEEKFRFLIREEMEQLSSSGKSPDFSAMLLTARLSPSLEFPSHLDIKAYKKEFPFMSNEQVFRALVIRAELKKIRRKKKLDVSSALRKLMFRLKSSKNKLRDEDVNELCERVKNHLAIFNSQAPEIMLPTKRRKRKKNKLKNLSPLELRVKKPKLLL